MHLTYQTITIRNAAAQDAPTLARWWNDGSVMAHAGFPLGLGTNPEKVAAELTTDTDDTRRRLLLLLNDIPIGEMCYQMKDSHTADIGIKICEQTFQERGIGRIALSLLIDALFRMGCQRIILDTNPKNLRARYVYELLGFRQLRLNQNSWKNQLGEWESSVDYELIPENFHNFTV